MNHSVSVADKQSFLKSFLYHYELKRRECAWLLNYLLHEEQLMERVHFVERAVLAPKAFIISAKGVDTIPFSFHKQKHVTTDVEKAFHDIRLNRMEHIYIELHFHGSKSFAPYLAVLEDNPYIPEYAGFAVQYKKEAEQFIAHSLRDFERKQILKAIDRALDFGDKQSFHVLVNELKELEKKQQLKPLT